MNLGFPECKEALIFAPHPDDEALGCSGTISRINDKGASSTVVFLTDGEGLNGAPSAEVAAARREEGRRASALLGCGEPVFLGLPDGELGNHIDEGRRRLSEIISLKKPDIVFAPSPVDHHQDHIATSVIGLKLLKEHRSFKLAFYEVYSTVRFTHLVDITEVIEQKKEAILTYRTSLYGKPDVYVRVSLGLNAHRSLFTQERRYYEAFWIVEMSPERAEMAEWLTYGLLKR